MAGKGFFSRKGKIPKRIRSFVGRLSLRKKKAIDSDKVCTKESESGVLEQSIVSALSKEPVEDYEPPLSHDGATEAAESKVATEDTVLVPKDSVRNVSLLDSVMDFVKTGGSGDDAARNAEEEKGSSNELQKKEETTDDLDEVKEISDSLENNSQTIHEAKETEESPVGFGKNEKTLQNYEFEKNEDPIAYKSDGSVAKSPEGTSDGSENDECMEPPTLHCEKILDAQPPDAKSQESESSDEVIEQTKKNRNSLVPKGLGQGNCFAMVFDLFSINETFSEADSEVSMGATALQQSKPEDGTKEVSENEVNGAADDTTALPESSATITAPKDDVSVSSGKKSVGKSPSMASKSSFAKDNISVASAAETVERTPSVASKISKASDRNNSKDAPSVSSDAKSTAKALSVTSKSSKPSETRSAAKDGASVTSAAKSVGNSHSVVSRSSAGKSSPNDDITTPKNVVRDEASARSFAKNSANDTVSAAKSQGKDAKSTSSQQPSLMKQMKSFASRAAKSMTQTSNCSKSKSAAKEETSVSSSKKEKPNFDSIVLNGSEDQDSVTSSIKESIYSQSMAGKVTTSSLIGLSADEIRVEMAKMKAKATEIAIADDSGKRFAVQSFLSGEFADNPNLWKLPFGEKSPLLPLASLRKSEIHVGGNFFTRLAREDLEGFIEETKEGGVAFCVEDRLWFTLSVTGLPAEVMEALEEADPTEFFDLLVSYGAREDCKASYRVEDIQFFCACIPGLMSYVKLSPEQEEQRQADLAAHEFLGEIVVKMRESGNMDNERELVDKASDILDVLMELGVENADERLDGLLTPMMAAQEEGTKDLTEIAMSHIGTVA